jgi:hypothetical protein
MKEEMHYFKFDSFICRERNKTSLEPILTPLQIGGLGRERIFISLDSSSLEFVKSNKKILNFSSL